MNMATQRVIYSNIGSNGTMEDPLREHMIALLTERGAFPDANGAYREEDLVSALHERGWGVEPEHAPGRITVKLVDLSKPSRYSLVEGDTLGSVLFEALRRSIGWQTADQEHHAFDQQTRALLGISADEFRYQWDSGQLDFEDPIVEHLGVSLPSGR
jgi:hypothetical protein